MSTLTTTVEELSEAIAAANIYVDEQGRIIAAALYDLLARGEPASVAELAAQTKVPEANLLAKLKAWPGVFWGEEDHVVGFWGIAIPEMYVNFHAEGGKPAYAWCALDPFLIVPTIGRPARVESRDPVTGESITMTVTPEGITDLSPASAVVSFIAPTKPFTSDVIQTFCDYVLNFTSRDSAERWAAERENIALLPASEAFEVGRRVLTRWGIPTEAATLP